MGNIVEDRIKRTIEAFKFMEAIQDALNAETQPDMDELVELACQLMKMRALYLQIADPNSKRAKTPINAFTVVYLNKGFELLKQLVGLDFRTLNEEQAATFLSGIGQPISGVKQKRTAPKPEAKPLVFK